MASGAGTPAGSGVVGMANRLVQMQMQMQMQQGQGTGQFSLIRPGLMTAMNRLPQPGMPGQEGEEEDNAEEEEDMGVAETYSDYMPSKPLAQSKSIKRFDEGGSKVRGVHVTLTELSIATSSI